MAARLRSRLVPEVRSVASLAKRVSQLELQLEDVSLRARLDLASQVADLRYGPRPTTSLHSHELRISSQNGEDGILLYLVSVVGSATQTFVEVGIGDGSECNSANLISNWGWSGTMVEASAEGAASAAKRYEAFDVNVVHEMVTAENVNSVVGSAPVDVLSIDIDGNDYWVWRAADTQARIVVVEYNASLGPERSVTIPYDPGFDYTTATPHRLYHGASLTALWKLAREKDMALVGCDSRGVNAFFIHKDFATGQLPELTPTEAWRPIWKRTLRLSQKAQEELASSLPLVDI